MPTKNAVKEYAPDSYYHVYTRGVNKELVFRDELDKAYFISLFKRYLSKERATSKDRFVYKNYAKEIELLAFCLMGNHLHILLYQHDNDSMSRFMRSMMTSYSMYFNKRYNRVGPVFQSRYLASRIDKDAYLHHISRYIHLNPRDWRSNQFTSISYYSGEKSAKWMQPQKILELFDGDRYGYLEFVADYADNESMLDELRYELADGYISIEELA